MNRRAFLGSLAAALVGATFDPERLLWVPGQRTFFLPSREPIASPPLYTLAPMSADLIRSARNSFVTTDMITKEWLKILQRNLVFSQRISREYDGRASCITFSIPSRFATR